ncbi:MAG: serine hydrolase [Isosphaeraceae bacterium]
MRSRRRVVLAGGVIRTLRADVGRPLGDGGRVGDGPIPKKRSPARVSVGSWARFALVAAVLAACVGGQGRVPVAPAPSEQASQSPPGPASNLDAKALDAAVRETLDALGEGARAAVWLGGPTEGPWYSWQADDPRPTASAIKTAFLVELFDRHAGSLSRRPMGLDAALADDHPAMAPYTPAQRVEIREALGSASARTLGRVMMGSDPAPNAVYNAAASAVTALLGGPEGLTQAIRARDPAFASFAVRRYMLAPRDVTGDNEATAAAMAAVLQRLASGELSGVDGPTLDALRDALKTQNDHLDLKGRHHVKNGALDSDPVTRVESGWWETPSGRSIVYVVTLTRPASSGPAKDVQDASTRLTRRLLGAIR